MKWSAIGSASAVFFLLAAPALSGEVWTFPVINKVPALVSPTDPNVKDIPAVYEALDPDEVTKKWHICVAMPNMNDDYYVAMNYGAVQEAKRFGIKMTMVSADGYSNLDKQISQVEDCVAQGVDAVLIMAISPTGLNAVIKEAREQGVVVIDFANGIDSTLIQARAKASYYDVGKTVGQYLAERHPKGSGKTKVFWLPGPPGAGWSEDANRGFHDALKAADSDIEILATQYGDTHKDIQMKLVEDGIQTYQDIDYIAGSAQGVEGAIQVLRETDRQDIKLVSSWITPYIDKVIREGLVLGAVTDSVVMQPRIAIDQAVRILEGKEYIKDTSPKLFMVDTDSVASYDRVNSMSPEGWKPVFVVD